MRPKRVYKNTKGRYYYLVNGKRKYIKTPKDMTDRKIVNINIKNYQPPSTSKKRKRRTKRRNMKYGSKVAGDMVPLERKTTGVVSQQLPTYLFEPGKQVDTFLSKRDREKELKDELKDLKLLTYVKPEVTDIVKPKNKKSATDDRVMVIINKTAPVARSFLNSLDTIDPVTSSYEKFKQYVLDNNHKDIQDLMEKSVRVNRGVLNTYRIVRDVLEEEREMAMRGSGDDGSKALWNDELEKILKKKIKNDYVPVIPSDKTDDLLEHVYEGMPDFSFIINTAPSTSDGSTDGHWRAVYIDNNDDYKTIEYYDSLVSRPEKTLIDIMRKIAKIINPETTFLYKQNNLKNQSDSTDTCGYFAVRFLELRNNGVPFSEATGYDDYIAKHKPDASMEGEGKINEVVKIYNSYI